MDFFGLNFEPLVTKVIDIKYLKQRPSLVKIRDQIKSEDENSTHDKRPDLAYQWVFSLKLVLTKVSLQILLLL